MQQKINTTLKIVIDKLDLFIKLFTGFSYLFIG